MSFALPITAAAGCAVANGISIILQKTGADDEAKVKSLDLSLIFRLFKNKPYLGGLLLQIVGWVLCLVALQVLPIFLVQSVIAASIVVTAIGEWIITRHSLNKLAYIAIIGVLSGLVLVGLAAKPSHATLGNDEIHTILELAPIVLIILGVFFIYLKKRISSSFLALLSGISFGATSLIGRIIVFHNPVWLMLKDPLLWALVVYAVLGQYLFTVALQRSSGTKANALMISTQTLVPSFLGILYFNDKFRDDLFGLVVLGAILVVVGCIIIGKVDKQIPGNVAR